MNPGHRELDLFFLFRAVTLAERLQERYIPITERELTIDWQRDEVEDPW